MKQSKAINVEGCELATWLQYCTTCIASLPWYALHREVTQFAYVSGTMIFLVVNLTSNDAQSDPKQEC